MDVKSWTAQEIFDNLDYWGIDWRQQFEKYGMLVDTTPRSMEPPTDTGGKDDAE